MIKKHVKRPVTIPYFLEVICLIILMVCFQEPIIVLADHAIDQLATEVHSKGWIVYCACSESGDWDLYLCRPDGSDSINITNTPDFNEAAPQFSRDGRQLLYRRLPCEEKIDGNAYGAQGELVLCESDGANPRIMSNGGYPWASWSPDGKQIVCLSIKGIIFYDIETCETLKKMDRKGFFQQLTWSPDGQWLSGVANNLGTSWSVARMSVSTGMVNPVSRMDCCTPDWFPDSQNLIFSNRPPGQKGNNGYGWTQLWRADAGGNHRELVYGEAGRHVYGGNVSPDGKYVLFTGNMNEDGDPGNQGAAMGLIRLSDAPIIAGQSMELRSLYPKANRGPVLTLPKGWEPSWTYSEVLQPETAEKIEDLQQALMEEIRDRGWIAYSAETDQGDWELYLMRPDGSNRRNISNSPQFNEAGIRFSPNGKKMLYYRMPKNIPVDNNTYGNQVLVVADADGTHSEIWGDEFPWASWSGDGTQFAILNKAGIHIVNIADKKVIHTLPRKGVVQQLGWSFDGNWFCGTANGLGVFWSIGRINAQTGEINAVSETDRFNCTPDWFHDSKHIIYSRGIIPDQGGWAELWMADGDGQNKRLLLAEDQRHIYGGALSPDDRYVLFTRSEADLGKIQNTKTRIGIVRFSETPIAIGNNESAVNFLSNIPKSPVADLGYGWEPDWTYTEVLNQ